MASFNYPNIGDGRLKPSGIEKSLNHTFRDYRHLDFPAFFLLVREVHPELPAKDILHHLIHDKGSIEVIVVGDEMAGFFMYSASPTANSTAWLNWFGIKGSFQGTELGNLLLERFERRVYAEGFNRIELRVAEDNQDAIALYARRDYTCLRRATDDPGFINYFKNIR